MENIQKSPLPPKAQEGQMLLTFPDAMREIINGKRVTRTEWGNSDIYGVLSDGLLMIRMDNKLQQWLISDGDMSATDWMVLE